MNILFRPYKDEDEVALLELYSAVNGEIQDKEHWFKLRNWQYKNNPAGKPIYWLAEYEKKIVGQYALIPAKIKFGDRVIIGYQSVDTKTHPDYQRRGIFGKLALKSYECASADVIYGFPNKNSYGGFVKKLGWLEVGALDALVKPLNIKNILQKYISSKLLLKVGEASVNIITRIFYNTNNTPKVDNLKITKISSFDDRIDVLWREISNSYNVMVVRNKEYLNWRYVNVPDVIFTIYIAEMEGKILGYIVIKCEKQRGLTIGRIFDFIVLPNQEIAGQMLIQKATEFFRDEKASLILYRLAGTKAYYKMLRNNGYIRLPFANRGVRFIIRINTIKISRNMFNGWLLQTGDADTV